MKKENETEILAEAVANGFAGVQASIIALSEKLDFVDRKLDNRFDLLERMMFENRRHDNDAHRELGTRVSQLEKTAV